MQRSRKDRLSPTASPAASLRTHHLSSPSNQRRGMEEGLVMPALSLASDRQLSDAFSLACEGSLFDSFEKFVRAIKVGGGLCWPFLCSLPWH